MKKQILIPVILSLLICISWSLFISMKRTDSVYVINAEVYNDFEMKKQLEARLVSVQQQRKSILDSLGLRIEMRTQSYRMNGASDTTEANAIRALQQDFYARQQQFEQDNSAMAAQYEEQIWKQLNQYAQDFGKEKGYTLVFGANGDGGIMYGDQSANVTEEMKAYANEKFKGSK
jgi:outer membrane protein